VNKTQKLILVAKGAVGYRSSTLFNLGETWYVWLLYSASCCLFEFLLFRDKRTIAQKKK
jgi:hypothetical protein